MLNETFIAVVTYSIDNTVACSQPDELIKNVFALIGFVSVMFSLITIVFTKGISNVIHGFVYAYAFIKYFIKKGKI